MTLTVVCMACMYARSLVSASPMIFPNSQSISDVRCYMILELHRNSLLPIPPIGLKVDDYYAVDYVSCYYFGRVIQIQGQFALFKFLHRVTVLEITVGHRTLSDQILKMSGQFHIMIGHDDRTSHQHILSYLLQGVVSQ